MKPRTGLLVLGAWIALAHAGEGMPPLTVEPGPEAQAEQKEQKEALPREKAPPARLGEVQGDFTRCVASELLRLELKRRVTLTDASRSSGKRWTEYSRSLALLERFEPAVAGCGEGERVMAQEIERLHETAIDYPDLRRAALARGPLTLSTAAQASEVLNGVDSILRNRTLKPGAGICPAHDPCGVELERRRRLLSEALRAVGE